MSKIQELLKPLPEGSNPGWELTVDGVPTPAQEISLVNPKFGEVRFGAAPVGGYGTWGFEEVGGGGSVIVPFYMAPRVGLMVGLVEQPRPFMSDAPVLNLPRGFLNPGGTHFKSAVREASEETGFREVGRVSLLEGDPGNPNPTFFVTLGLNDNGEPKGIRFYGLEFQADEIGLHSDGLFRFFPGVVEPITKDAEKIMSCRFLHWSKVAGSSCMITNAGVTRLMATNYLDDRY